MTSWRSVQVRLYTQQRKATITINAAVRGFLVRQRMRPQLEALARARAERQAASTIQLVRSCSCQG